MNHAMTNRIDVSNALDFSNAGVFRAGPTHDHVDGRPRVAQTGGRALSFAPGNMQFDDRFSTDSLDASSGEALIRVLRNLLEVGGNQLKLDRRATAV